MKIRGIAMDLFVKPRKRENIDAHNAYILGSDFKQVKRISLPKKKTYNYLIYYSTLFINPSLK